MIGESNQNILSQKMNEDHLRMNYSMVLFSPLDRLSFTHNLR